MIFGEVERAIKPQRCPGVALSVSCWLLVNIRSKLGYGSFSARHPVTDRSPSGKWRVGRHSQNFNSVLKLERRPSDTLITSGAWAKFAKNSPSRLILGVVTIALDWWALCFSHHAIINTIAALTMHYQILLHSSRAVSYHSLQCVWCHNNCALRTSVDLRDLIAHWNCFVNEIRITRWSCACYI